MAKYDDLEDMFDDDLEDDDDFVVAEDDDDNDDNYSDEEDDDEDDEDNDYEDEDDDEEDARPKKKGLKFGFSGKGSKKKPKEEKPKKETIKSVHGLKRKESKERDPYKESKGSPAKLIIAGVGVVAVIGVIIAAGGVMNSKISKLNSSNENLTQQIASRTINVYVAKRDIAKGDEIIVSGDNANVSLSQIYTSLSSSSYIDDTASGYAQVDIASGMPVMVNDIGNTNPVTALSDAVAEFKAEYTKAKEIPYRITADFVEAGTGNALVESRDLTLDAGANEKAFNIEAESIDGYVLKTIQVDGESVHAYGVSEKSMKQGIVNMYYYTTKGGWGRHEMKGNIRVTYTYVKKSDPSAEETDVFDDSAWIDTTEAANNEESVTTEVSDVDVSEADASNVDTPELSDTPDETTESEATNIQDTETQTEDAPEDVQ